MRRQKQCQHTNRLLELTFYRLFLRLNYAERQRVAQDLVQAHRRQWFIVDEHGVRRLEE
mgnify:CR=1 FL=1